MFSNHQSARQLVPAISLILMSALTLSACSDSESEIPGTGAIPPDDSPVGIPDTPDGLPADPPVIVPESGQFPVDIDSDDRPGMIVTGLEGRDSPDIQTRWLVNMGTFRLESRTPGTGDGFVSLVEYENGIRLSSHIEFYEPQIDTCEVDDPNVPPPIGDDGDGGSPPPSISGGQTVSINSTSVAWFLFNRTFEDNGDVTYETNNGLPSALPAGATLSIPGDQFPTITAHPLFEPEAPVRLLPEFDTPVTADSVYSWMPGPESGYMEVSFLAYDSLGDFVDFVGRCEMADDGSFDMPQSVRNFIADSPLAIEARYARVYSRIDLIDDIAIRQRIIVAE